MQGARVYTYRRKSSLIVTLGLALFMTAFLVLFNIGWTNQEIAAGRTPFLGVVFTLPFVPIVAYLFRMAFVWMNEKIILTDREVVWIDARGRERLRQPLTSIRRLSFNTNVGSEETLTVATVETDAGTFKYSSAIGNYRDLSARLTDLARPHSVARPSSFP